MTHSEYKKEIVADVGRTIGEIEAEYCSRPETPVLRGRVIGREIVVHCPYCDTEHWHSWEPGETKPGERVPHCGNESPIRDRCYCIAPFRKDSPLAY